MFSAALKSGAAAAPTDPDFENVTLLLHGDGTNGGQNNTFLDSSTNNFTITRNGNTTQGSFSPYGPNWSNYFDGTADYLSLANNTNWVLGTSYTVEAWVNFSDLSGQDIICGSNSRWWLSRSLTDTGVSSGKFGFSANAGSWNSISSTTTPVVGVWYHVAATISSGTVSLYVNGVREATGSLSIATDNIDLLDIGNWNGGAFTYGTNGYISNLRLVKGSIIYTGASFTVPTAPLTAVTNTVLLTCADNRFIDDSTNNYTITRNGDVSVQRFSPFAPPAAYNPATIGGSGYFDGASDFLTVPAATQLDISTGDFTIEAWVYLNVMPTTDNLIDFANWMAVYVRGNPSASDGWQFQIGQTVLMLSDSYGTAVCFGTHGMVARAWYHVSVTRSGNTFRVFVNGVQVGTSTSSISLNTGATYWIGSETGQGAYLNGYMSNLRAVKGTALYTTNFTPPTAPVTAVSGTGLLANYTNGAIFDNAMMNDLETVGNAQISTSVVKFGTGSMAFDGTGDFLVVGNPASNPNLDFGSGNFTVETWIYPLGTATYLVAGSLADLSGNGCWWLLVNGTFSGGSTIQFGYNTTIGGSGTNVLAGSGTLPTSTWSHIAVTRSGSSIRCFVNGTQVGTTNTGIGTSAIAAVNQNILIGQSVNGGPYSMNGYLDDMRFTKGVARYTATFTPPTAAFPNN
jgi:hypothetical protein